MSRTDAALVVGALLCLVVVVPSGARLALISVLIGGAVTAFFSWNYYQRASNDLEDEAAKLREESENVRRHTTLILRGLEEAGLIELNWDEQGEIVSIRIKRTATASVGNSDAASSATMRRGEDDKDAPANQE